jgi:hypothetical protein
MVMIYCKNGEFQISGDRNTVVTEIIQAVKIVAVHLAKNAKNDVEKVTTLSTLNLDINSAIIDALNGNTEDINFNKE